MHLMQTDIAPTLLRTCSHVQTLVIAMRLMPIQNTNSMMCGACLEGKLFLSYFFFSCLMGVTTQSIVNYVLNSYHGTTSELCDGDKVVMTCTCQAPTHGPSSLVERKECGIREEIRWPKLAVWIQYFIAIVPWEKSLSFILRFLLS